MTTDELAETDKEVKVVLINYGYKIKRIYTKGRSKFKRLVITNLDGFRRNCNLSIK